MENTPIMETTDTLLSHQQPIADHTDSIWFGDPVTSFRQCLKRYNHHACYMFAGDLNDSVIQRYRLNDFPYHCGLAPGAITPTADGDHNFSTMTLLNWVTPAYVCRRGGIRWKYYWESFRNEHFMGLFLARRLTGPSSFSYLETTVPSTTAARRHEYFLNIPPTWNGAHATAGEENPVLEIELPYYETYRFSPARTSNYTSIFSFHQHYHELTASTSSSNLGLTTLYAFVATAEDFNLTMFIGAPVVFYYPKSNYPAPSG